MSKNQTYASVFCVWNNPRYEIIYKHDEAGNILKDENDEKIILEKKPTEYTLLTDQEICDLVLKKWVDSGNGRIGAVVYCVSEAGLHHLHMVLEVQQSDSKRFRFSAVKKLYPKAHIEPTRGNKQEAEDYINKVGKYAEKGELITAKAQEGELTGNQGNRADLVALGELVDLGMSPNEIMDLSITNRRFEKYIKASYYRKKLRDTPFERDVKVYYHCGAAGTGKSHSASKLVNLFGRDSLYFVSDYSSGWIDNYSGERILWLDEFQGQLSYSTLKSLLDKIVCQVHARYSNIYALWDEVHITSIYPVEELYKIIVPRDQWKNDTYDQLSRRISTIVYHYIESDEYKAIELPMSKYHDINTMKHIVAGDYVIDGFCQVDCSDIFDKNKNEKHQD